MAWEEIYGPGGYLYQGHPGDWYVPGSGAVRKMPGGFRMPQTERGWEPGWIVGPNVVGGERYNRLIEIAGQVSGITPQPTPAEQRRRAGMGQPITQPQRPQQQPTMSQAMMPQQQMPLQQPTMPQQQSLAQMFQPLMPQEPMQPYMQTLAQQIRQPRQMARIPFAPWVSNPYWSNMYGNY